MGIIFRLVKFALNGIGLYIMSFVSSIVTTIVYRYPDCEFVRIKMLENIGEALLIYVPYVGIMTGINFLIERKIEKRPQSKEFVWLFYISLLVLTIALTYNSYNLYIHCRK
jgi:hypothetical protein